MNSLPFDNCIWDSVETIKPEERQELQLELLKKVVERVYNKVPFYKNSFDKHKAVSYTHLTLPTIYSV